MITEAVSRMLTYLDFDALNIINISNSAANLLHNVVEILKVIWSNIDPDAWSNIDEFLELVKLAERKVAPQIDRILEQANIPEKIYWSISAVMQEEVIPKHLRATEAILN